MIVGTHHPVKAAQVWEPESYFVPSNRNPCWELIVSPNDEMPIHRFFDVQDIQTSYDPNIPQDNWCPGTIFQHRKTGKRIEIYNQIRYVQRKGKIVPKASLRLRVIKQTDQLELEM